MRSLKYRLTLACLALVGALWLLVPTFLPSSLADLPGIPSTHINLGLDLKGGVQLTLGVDTGQAVQSALTSAGQQVRQRALEAGITVFGPHRMPGGGISLTLANAGQWEAFRKVAANTAPQLVLAEGRPNAQLNGGKSVSVVLSFVPEFARQTGELALNQVLKTITGRIDQFGVAEPDIRKQSDDRILIQLPGLTDAARAAQLVGRTAQLSFHLVRDDAARDRALPPGTAFFPFAEVKHGGDESRMILDTLPLLRGEDVADARPTFDDKGRSMVSLTLTPSGADRFEQVTGEHKGKRLAIVLDGAVRSAPVIQDRIAGGSASISGNFTAEEAQDLAIALRSGSLAAPVHVLEERSVGPALGQASIVSGLLAALVGTVAVMVIMPLRYGGSGMLANGMLFCTLALLMAGMAALGATLTLPGIAGVVLTIGMAVDANVLIYERIREELEHGLAPVKAIAAGFERANLSITDSNLTTVFVAAILYQFGTGPVRGFAVTLILGIIASMFTAIFLCRIAMDIWMRKNGGASLSITGPMRLTRTTAALSRFRFVHYAKHVAVAAALLLLIASASAGMQGGLRYGVDFSGGVAAQVSFAQPVEDAQVKNAFAPLDVHDVSAQQYGEDGKVWLTRFAVPDIPPQELNAKVRAALNAAFDQDGQTVSLDRLEMVGPKAGDELRASALEAIYYALLLITVYISGRFEHRWGMAALLAGSLTSAMAALQWAGVPVEWRIAAALALALFLCGKLRLAFAVGAMASLLFDMITTISLLILLGQEIDLNIVAALLTILGYSLNDTIVIYDRIRENLRREDAGAPRPLRVIVQESLGETMSRTLLTGGTTLAAALALYLLGGPVIHGFALTMFIGVVMGTLSSLFVAAPLLPLFGSTPAFKAAVTPARYERPGEAGVV